jgi:hypothetical protein
MLNPRRAIFASKEPKDMPSASVEIVSIFLEVYSFNNMLNPLPFGRYLIDWPRLIPISLTNLLTISRTSYFYFYFS